ncbi:MAG: transcription termination/antitermination protein NusG [Armatimonadota bacterium]|nr:transcription termination/antitermination protein NusG [Armatimonadota bacterium]MCX7777194.1 transcription termination/antitermination protein NusG [Armatimonadota bacterium]MDW8025021.1 transcription termination/antitermination protein NusG [Armatimonadota bacterium]
MQKKWYVIHVLTSYEERVKRAIEKLVEARELHDKIGRVVIPVERERRFHGGVRQVERKLFPGYILVEMVADDDTLYFIRRIPGVTGFAGSQTKPVPLRDQEVETILKISGEEMPRRKSIWHRGEKVRVHSGPFEGAEGVIEEVHQQKQTLTVMLSLFGRETPVELDFSQVEKVEE